MHRHGLRVLIGVVRREDRITIRPHHVAGVWERD